MAVVSWLVASVFIAYDQVELFYQGLLVAGYCTLLVTPQPPAHADGRALSWSSRGQYVLAMESPVVEQVASGVDTMAKNQMYTGLGIARLTLTVFSSWLGRDSALMVNTGFSFCQSVVERDVPAALSWLYCLFPTMSSDIAQHAYDWCVGPVLQAGFVDTVYYHLSNWRAFFQTPLGQILLRALKVVALALPFASYITDTALEYADKFHIEHFDPVSLANGLLQLMRGFADGGIASFFETGNPLHVADPTPEARLMVDVSNFELDTLSDPFDLTVSSFCRYRKFDDRARDLSARLDDLSRTDRWGRLIPARLKLDRLVAMLERRQQNDVPDICPVGVLLYGAPGVGKSSAMTEIMAGVCKLLDLPYSTFTRPVHSKYDDGYAGQTILNLGDIGFVKTSDPGQYAAIGDLFTKDRKLMNMAFDDKGKVYMSSPFVVATTNVPYGGAHSHVADPRAFARRFITFQVTLSATNAEGRFDADSFDPASDPRVFRLITYPQDGPETFSGAMGIADVVSYIYQYARHDFDQQIEYAALLGNQRTLCPGCGLSSRYPKRETCPEGIHVELQSSGMVYDPTFVSIFAWAVMNMQVLAFLTYCFVWGKRALGQVSAFGVMLAGEVAETKLFLGSLDPRVWLSAVRAWWHEPIIRNTRVGLSLSRYHCAVGSVFSIVGFLFLKSRFNKRLTPVLQGQIPSLGLGSEPPAARAPRQGQVSGVSSPSPPTVAREAPVVHSKVDGSWRRPVPLVLGNRTAFATTGLQKFQRAVYSMLDPDGFRVAHACYLGDGQFLTLGHALEHFKALPMTLAIAGDCDPQLGGTFELVVDFGHVRNYTSDLVVFQGPKLQRNVIAFRRIQVPDNVVAYLLTDKGPIKVHKVLHLPPQMVSGHVFEDPVSYIGASQSGFCGAPLVVEDGGEFVAIGVHYSGSGQVGYSTCFDLSAAAAVPPRQLPKTWVVQNRPVALQSLDSHCILHKLPPMPLSVAPVGSLGGGALHLRTKIVASRLNGMLGAPFELDHHVPVDGVMKNGEFVGGFAHFLRNKARPRLEDPTDLPSAVDDVFDLIAPQLELIGFEADELDMIQMLQGDADLGLKPLDLSTSVGYPFTGTKSGFVTRDSDGRANGISHSMQLEYDRAVSALLSGDTPGLVYRASLKDEPQATRKVGRARVFFAGSMVATLLTRRFFGSLDGAIKKLRGATGFMPGVNALGQEWTDIARSFEGFDMFDFDYQDYDAMSHVLLDAASDLLLRLLRRFGASESHVESARLILVETFNPIFVANGDVYMASQLNPSGQGITTLLNGIVNALLITLVGRSLGLKLVEDYKFLVYGDDGAVGTRDKRLSFAYFQEYLGRRGYVVTPGDKVSGDGDFGTIFDITFLKRGFRYDDELDAVMAPLHMQSITRMLSFYKRGGLGPDEHLAAVVDNAQRELFHHGRQVYDTATAVLKRALGGACDVYSFDHWKAIWLSDRDAMVTWDM